MSKLKIGIISGFGAAAGAHFLDSLIRECQYNGASKDGDFPEIILHSISCDAMSERGIKNDVILFEELTKSVYMMNALQCDKIVLACTTCHIYHCQLQKLSRATILNMIDCAVKKCSEHKKVGVLSSRTINQCGIFNHHFEKYGVIGVGVTDHQQEILDTLIEKAIAGRITIDHADALFEIIDSLIQRGAGTVIVGCTEIPLITHKYSNDYHSVDAGKLLIEEILK